MDDILMIPVHCALLCFAVFFLGKKLPSFSESVTFTFKSLFAEVAADLEGGGIFRGSPLDSLPYN